MNWMDDLRKQLYTDEGKVPYVYQDSKSYWTIGVGKMVDRRKGGGLSDDEIEYILGNDVRRVSAELLNTLPWFNKLNDVRKAALGNMCFQMGLPALLGFKNMLKALSVGDYQEAYKEALDSKWAKIDAPSRAMRVASALRDG